MVFLLSVGGKFLVFANECRALLRLEKDFPDERNAIMMDHYQDASGDYVEFSYKGTVIATGQMVPIR